MLISPQRARSLREQVANAERMKAKIEECDGFAAYKFQVFAQDPNGLHNVYLAVFDDEEKKVAVFHMNKTNLKQITRDYHAAAEVARLLNKAG